MELRVIRTDEDLDWALADIEQYFDAPPAPGTAEADRFDILTDLIEAYENREYPIEALDPIETLKVFMDIKKKKQSAKATAISRSKIRKPTSSDKPRRR